MIPVIVLARNNLELTKKCIESIRKQDVPVSIWLIDNGSSDNTPSWALSQYPKDLNYTHFSPQIGVAAAWNHALKYVFREAGAAVVVNNDTVLRPDTVRHLVADGGGFVTAISTDDPEKILPVHAISYKGETPEEWRPEGVTEWYLTPDPTKKRKHPDFSCFLIRREVFENVGQFEERFKGAYCEDGDYHIRMHRAGITAWALELPFLHYRSSTLKNADPIEQRLIQMQADKNRALFKQIYGFEFGSPEYYAAMETTPYEHA